MEREKKLADPCSIVAMLRPESWASPVGASASRVSAGKPGGPRFVAGRRRPERGVKSLFGGRKPTGRNAARHESCSLVRYTTSRAAHVTAKAVFDRLAFQTFPWSSPSEVGGGTYARLGSEQERPVFPVLSAKTARISQW
jgi:hypothetical protein